MSLVIKGKILQVLKPESGTSRSGNQWQKQEFIVETDDQFQRKVCFTLFNDKVSLLEGINPGEEVEVAFNLESREYNGKWFHNINAWKIDRTTAVKEQNSPVYRPEDIPPEPEDYSAGDLPF